MLSNAMAKKLELLAGFTLLATIFFLPIATSLTGILFILAAVFYYAAGNWRTKFNIIKHNPVALSLLAFFALFVFGFCYTIAPFSDALQMLGKYDRFLLAALLIPLFAQDKWREYAINTFLCSISLVLILSYIKYFAHMPWSVARGPAELFKNHIDFNFLLGIATYLLMLKVVRAKNRYLKVAYILLILLLIYDILFMSIGRTGYVIFAALIVIFFMQMFRWKGVVIAMIFLPLLFISAYYSSITFKVYVSAIVTDIQAYRQHNEISSVGERYNFSKNSLELIGKRPLLGYGTGSFKYAYATLKPTPVPLTNNPHNEYMHIGVQFGAVGILLLCFMFAFQLWQSRYLPRDMRFLAQAIILAIAIGSLANSWLLDSVEGNLYVYFIALCFAAMRKTERSL